MDCCQDVPIISCLAADINKRIEPIQYNHNTLFIDSNLSVEDGLSVGGANLSVEDGHLNLPARTLINGVPLLDGAFASIQLPTNTTIGGYFPITEQYYYYYTAASGVSFYAGYILNGKPTFTGARTAASNQRCFSFIAPEDCVLTSLKLLFVFQPGNYPSPIASVFMDVMDTNLAVYYTGVYFDVPLTTTGRSFVKTEFEYLVKKGDSVAVWVQSNIPVAGSIAAFATLGYKVMPPPSVLSYAFHFKTTQQNRFPFNNILGSVASSPVGIWDQLTMFSSRQPIYGRPMTRRDYDNRLKTEKLYDDPEQAVLFFSDNKKDGWYISVSSSLENTAYILEQDHGWRGLMVDSAGFSDDTDAPPQILDYLFIDGILGVEVVEPILQRHKSGFVSFCHNGNDDAHSTIGNMLIYHGYAYLFTNISVEKDEEITTTENWYAHPDIINPSVIQKIQDHPSNKDHIASSKCIEIIRQLFWSNPPTIRA